MAVKGPNNDNKHYHLHINGYFHLDWHYFVCENLAMCMKFTKLYPPILLFSIIFKLCASQKTYHYIKFIKLDCDICRLTIFVALRKLLLIYLSHSLAIVKGFIISLCARYFYSRQTAHN